MASVTIQNLCKQFKDVAAVKDMNLEIRDKEFLVLVGPSGCGKTTALRMVAGLEEATSGEIRIDGRVVNDVSPKDRDIAMVFQNYALYPHMTVYDNMAFGLRLRRAPGFMGKRLFDETEIRNRVSQAAGVLDLGQLLHRKPKELSGGQRQRVALGRAIVREPKVFLMDEPLSNLDAKLRVQTRAELIKLHRRLGVTTIYVTHDQVEAMTMGDRIAVMKDGLIQQVDTPLGLYHRPTNKFVAGFIGSPAMNFLPGVLVRKNGRVWVKSGDIQLVAPDELVSRLNVLAPEDAPVQLGIRPENMSVCVPGTPPLPGASFRAAIDVVEPMGATSLLYLTVGKNQVIACVDAESAAREGHVVDIAVDTARLHLFGETEDAL